MITYRVATSSKDSVIDGYETRGAKSQACAWPLAAALRLPELIGGGHGVTARYTCVSTGCRTSILRFRVRLMRGVARGYFVVGAPSTQQSHRAPRARLADLGVGVEPLLVISYCTAVS